MENEDKKKSKKNKSWILGLLLGGAAIGGGTTVVVVNQNKDPQDGEMVVNTVSEDIDDNNNHTEGYDIDFDDENAGVNSDMVGNEQDSVLGDVEFPFGKGSVHLEPSGQIKTADKNKNMNNLLAKLGDNSGYEIDFKDSDPLFATDRVGNEIYRKMYEPNLNLDIRNSVISGYDINFLSVDKMKSIGETKSEKLGYIYFDYGYANDPESIKMATKKTVLNRVEYSEVRYSETLYGLAKLISSIPSEMLDKTVFYLEGHTDRVSDHEFNQVLSENRALSIKNLMVSHFDIKENHIVTVGHSWDQMVVNTTEACADNRRVEVKFTVFE